MQDITLEQYPYPQSRLVRHAGDLLKVSLTLSHAATGNAFIRTNLGNAAIHRQEQIDRHEHGKSMLGRDWQDIQMRRIDSRHFAITLPLWEVGYFDFKCYFISETSPQSLWPRGENARVKVEPAYTIAGNTIYNAFIRQFGPNCQQRSETPEINAAVKLLDQANYCVIPPSGSYDDFARHLDFIMGEMGFRIIQFLPVHPVPTNYGRMGRFGSPFAPRDFFSVDAGMAVFDQTRTPMDQFTRLIDQIHERNGLVFLDLPIDHTGWASTLHSSHPEWFKKAADGSFLSPGAWGVVWADLCKLDFSNRELWKYLSRVFLHWCSYGVDGFRCDAGYMIPADAWTYIIAKVRQQYANTIFFLEGLGGGQDATTRLLDDAGMDWAYSELFQNYSRDEVHRYLNFACGYSASHGALVNFAETHDNERLAGKGSNWARLRILLNALFSPGGCFGIANGVEWLATERIDVHDAAPLNWGASQNMTKLLQQLNTLLIKHPAFWADATTRVPYGANGGVGMLRQPARLPYPVMVIVNPSLETPTTFEWNFQEFDPGATPLDLLTGRKMTARYRQCLMEIMLKPGQVLCLALPDGDLAQLPSMPYNAVQRQQLLATAIQFIVARFGCIDVSETNVDAMAEFLFRNPLEFLKQLNGSDTYLPVVEWYPEHDAKRVVLMPPDHHLLINCTSRFRASLIIDGKCIQHIQSIPRADGRSFALFRRITKVTRFTRAELRLALFHGGDRPTRIISPLLLLPNADHIRVSTRLDAREITVRHCAIATTEYGGYGLLRAAWGSLGSQYDAMMAVNPTADMPADRIVTLARCRAWIIHRDYSHEVNLDCQDTFSYIAENTMQWDFTIPTGMGQNIQLRAIYHLDRLNRRMTLRFKRLMPPAADDLLAADTNSNNMSADQAVTLLVRPDIDDRCNHGNTIAYASAEHDFPKRIVNHATGFTFKLACGQQLQFQGSGAEAEWSAATEWSYSIHHRLEQERGLQDHGDLFSPGLIKFQLHGGEDAWISADLTAADTTALPEFTPIALPECDRSGNSWTSRPLGKALKDAINAFVVKRDDFKSIIAGYPWFLDWGRDTLLCARGLIAAGRLDDALSIIRVFASYEDHGTLPNMINGKDVSNRDTTDAPLLLFAAVRDYIAVAGDSILSTDCRGRRLDNILKSIVDNYIKGTSNGIRMDKQSCLVFSPAHFTWMDTNYPAATPREGYPVEIQALWYSALIFLAKCFPKEKYLRLSQQVETSFAKFYPSGKFTGLSDCLHCHEGQSASEAIADDACRPNQLLAITTGLIKDPSLRRHVIQACSALLVPGAIRSLASQPVNYKLPVTGANGIALNDPANPYIGQYSGDEDTRRKPAYHNGTAWGLQMPTYCEALYVTYGESALTAARSILATTALSMEEACLGQLPEIKDGDFPHTVRGCCAQAWSATEAYRVWKMLNDATNASK